MQRRLRITAQVKMYVYVNSLVYLSCYHPYYDKSAFKIRLWLELVHGNFY